MMDKKISTTALAKEKALTKPEVDSMLSDRGYISKGDKGWELSDAGKSAGGEYKESDKFGTYITWPSTILDEFVDESTAGKYISATELGKHFHISRNTVNPILSELGWVKKGIKGWVLTEQGKAVGGYQKEHPQTGIPYVMWAESILKNNALIRSVSELKGTDDPKTVTDSPAKKEEQSFREKFMATSRCADGHYVRSRAEMLIDNWLYMAEVIHAYERKLPVEEDVYCDFYLPTGKVYIEFWGYEDDPKYQERKKKKLEIYKKYNFNLIQLADKDIQNLDDVLPRELLKQGVQTY